MDERAYSHTEGSSANINKKFLLAYSSVVHMIEAGKQVELAKQDLKLRFHADKHDT